MRNRTKETRNGWKNHFPATGELAALAVLVAAVVLSAPRLRSQQPAGQSQRGAAARPAFDAASVKANKSGDQNVQMMFQPGGRFIATNDPVRNIITTAYQTKPQQMIAGPEWDRLLSEYFDIETKAAGNPSVEQMRLMLQSLLADRFKLAVHHESRRLPIYALVLSKAGRTGPQLTTHSDDTKCIDPTAGTQRPLPSPGEELPAYCGLFSILPIPGALHETGSRITMDRLVTLLSLYVDRAVVDRTGLTGVFDLTLEFAPPEGPASQPDATASAADPAAPPSIFAALQDQLGLRLEPQTGPVDVLVIDHVEEPSPN
jgi:uncharacterized protein (TIGR03435 family)